jgi:Flp pilus assembly protein TadG
VGLSRRERRRGSGMVELAIVLPVLLMIFFAIAEFSMLFLQWQAVTTAAREGARAASLFRPNCSLNVQPAVDQAVADVLNGAGIPPVTPTLSGACVYPGSSQVVVSVPYQFQILPGFVGTLGDSIDLSATSVMRNELTGGGA